MIAPAPERVLDRYRVGGRLAAGAAGTVVAAVDEETGLEVVVKFFDGSEDNFSAWVREVRLAMRLRHPNIPACINAGHDPAWGLSVLVFERARGGSLRRALAGGLRLAPDGCRRLLADVAAALAYSHEHGVVHRDVKPENILAARAPGEAPWLLADFGAGRFLAPGQATRGVACSPAGSWEYMAPEAMSRGASAASDQYSLGVVGAELLTGSVPDRRGRSAFRLAGVDAGGLAGLLSRMLEPDPGRRFPALEVVERVLEDPAAPWDVTTTRDGSHLAFVGADLFVRRRGAAALERVGRVPGARRFVNAWGDGSALLAAEDRLFALTPFARPVAAAPGSECVVADGERGLVWSVEGGAPCVRSFTGTRARAEPVAPEAWRGGPLLGVPLPGGRVVLGARGGAWLVWAALVGARVEARLVAAPGPLHDLRRVGGAAVGLFGDASTAAAALCGEAGLAAPVHCAQGVDELGLELRGDALVVESLVSSPVQVLEDDGT